MTDPRQRPRLPVLIAPILIGAVLAAGCADIRVTDPDRTATQQFLMTEAIARAADQLAPETMRDRRVFVTGELLDVPQASYLLAAVRAQFLEQGARLVSTRQDAEIVVEVRSRGVGVDRSENLVGLPAVLLPADSKVGGVQASTLITPEIAFYKKINQQGFAAVAFSAYWRDTGELVGSAGPYFGYTTREDIWIFGVGPTTTGNIPTVRPPTVEPN